MKEDIRILEEFIKYFEAEAISRKYSRNISITVGEDDIEAIEHLISAYKKLEEENKELKNKIKWKPIKEYSRNKYDWVLVKYYDDDYECVPAVAEMRINDKWYDRSNNEIPFTVKYFVDIQELLEERNK